MCMTAQAMKAGYKKFNKLFEGRASNYVLKNAMKLHPIAQDIHYYMGKGPNTVVQADCHAENSYFVKNNETKAGFSLGIYDFQLLRIGRPTLDLASFIAGSTKPEVFGNDEQVELNLLKTYLNELGKYHGNKDGKIFYLNKETGIEEEYTLNDIYIDYKMGLSMLLVWNVAAALAVPFDTIAQHDYFEYMIRLCNRIENTSAINFALSVINKNNIKNNIPLPIEKIKLYDINNKNDLEHIPHLKENIQLHKARHTQPNNSLIGKIKYQLKYKFIKKMTSSRKGYHGNKMDEIPLESMELPHPVDIAIGTDFENDIIDSYYLSAFAPTNEKNSASCYIRLCRRNDKNLGEVWFVIYIPNLGVFKWIDHPNTNVCAYEQDGDSICCEPLKNSKTINNEKYINNTKLIMKCIKPMDKWIIKFDGYVKKQEDNSIHHMIVNIDWNKKMNYFSFGTNVDPGLTSKALALEPFSKQFFDELKASHQEHFEQFGQTKGNIIINNTDEYDFGNNCIGMRDRAFGCRNWGYMQRYIASYFVTPSLQFHNITLASLPTLTNAKLGFVKKSNENSAISITALSGNFEKMGIDGIPAKELELSYISQGINYTYKMTIIKTIGLNMGPNGMWVNLRIAEFELRYIDPETNEFKIEKSIGASEFGYRFKNASFKRPTTKILSPISFKDKNL